MNPLNSKANVISDSSGSNSLVADPQTSKQGNTEEVIDLRQYYNIINKYKWRIGWFAFAMAIFASVIVLNMTPIYRASATLLIEADQAKAVSFEEIVGLDSNRKEYYLTQFEIIKSRDIARKVIDKLNLKEHVDFIGKPSFLGKIKASIPFLPKRKPSNMTSEESDEHQMQGLIKRFSSRLSISPIRKTQLVNISYESSDAKMAAVIANTVGETYIEENLAAKMGVSKKAGDWLTTRLSSLKIRLKSSEEKLQDYREKENLIDIEGVLGLASKELEQTSEQLVIARNDKNKLESIVRVIDEYGRNNIEMLESITEITSQPVIQNVKNTLTQIELKVSDLSKTYGPKHPKMISAQSEFTTVKRNLSTQIKRLITGVEKQLITSKRNVIALDNELLRIRKDYQLVTRKENAYRQLSREVETNRHLYDTFLSRSKETEITSDFNSAVARFIDRAFKPDDKIKPKKTLIVILVFIAMLGLGVVIAFVVEALDNTFKSAADIENKLLLRMLGLLPLVDTKKTGKLDTHFFFDPDDKSFSESVRTLRTSFVLNQLGKKSQMIEVTSSVPGEGKSTVAINLAFSLGQIKKTILIDADMRRPSIRKQFNIPAYHPGLANLIAGTEKFEDCIYFDKKSGITILPCGQTPPNPLELLSSPRFTRLLEGLKSKFDHVVIDTPPINAVSDSLVISQKADAVIYVVKSDDTRINVVQHGVKRLLEAKAKLAGVVLNQVDTSKVQETDYYHGYYDAYSYGDSGAAKDDV
ncbi:MAG: chain-length determining protein [Kangiella sp.]|nr:MAG: chain-length determining protein [Kangiella sp.]